MFKISKKTLRKIGAYNNTVFGGDGRAVKKKSGEVFSTFYALTIFFFARTYSYGLDKTSRSIPVSCIIIILGKGGMEGEGLRGGELERYGRHVGCL